MLKKYKHIIVVTILVYSVMLIGSLIPLSFGFLNPFEKGITDYESTDLIFCKFKNQVDFDERIVIVNVGKPDRDKIARGLEKIHQSGAKVIGVDIILEEQKDSLTDAHLERVIRNNNNIVLADEIHFDSTSQFPNFCNRQFCQMENTAYVNFVAKPDHSIRYFSPREYFNNNKVDAFSAAISKRYDESAYQKLSKRTKEVEQIHYRGIADSYAHIELDELLEEGDYRESFNGKIVLLGYSGEDEWSLSARDKFYTPMNGKFTLKSLPDMFGVAIHANIISMILDGEYINDMNLWLNRILCLIIVICMVNFSLKLYKTVSPGYWKTVRLFQLLVLFSLFIVSTISFYYFHYKINLTVALIGVGLSWDVVKVYQGVYIKKQRLFQSKNV